MNVFRRWLGRDPVRLAAAALFHAIVDQARLPAFFDPGAVDDTIDGRFDLVALHVSLVVARLRPAGPPLQPLAQALFDEMVGNFDVGLREAGVGDLGVGKRVKKLVQAFYGRLSAYEAALADGSAAALEEALGRNLYRGRSVDPSVLAAMADYMRHQAAHLAGQSDAALAAGELRFLPFAPDLRAPG